MSNDNTPSSGNISDVETVIRQSNLIVAESRKPETANLRMAGIQHDFCF